MEQKDRSKTNVPAGASGTEPAQERDGGVETGASKAPTQGVRSAAMRAEFFSGPIPPPELLREYNKLIPNGAERILAMAERQEAHRHELEKAIVRAEIQQGRLGLILGFVVVMTMGIGGMLLIWHGDNVNGLAIVLSSLVGLVGSFVYSAKRKRSVAREQNEESPRGKEG